MRIGWLACIVQAWAEDLLRSTGGYEELLESAKMMHREAVEDGERDALLHRRCRILR